MVINWDELARWTEAGLIEALRNDAAFLSAEHRRDQCYHACRILRLERRPAVPYSLISRLLKIDKGFLRRQFKWGLAHPDGPGPNGRPRTLSQEQRDAVIEGIYRAYTTRVPWTIADVKAYIADTFQVYMPRQTIHDFLSQDSRVRTCRGVPMEDKRVEVTQEQIAEFFARATAAIDGVPSHFVFNMDEMGHQDWADRTEQVCAVPSTHSDDHVYLPVSRAGKRITLLACIAADGSAITPQVIIPRKTVDDDLVLTGLSPEKVVVRSQPKGYVNTQLFDGWFVEIFLPALARRREAQNYRGPAVLLLDQCSAHRSALFAELCEEHKVRACFLPPHSSNQPQPLDLCLFGVTKSLLRRTNRLDSVNVQTKHIARVVCAVLAAAVPTTIVQSFMLAGICLVKDGEDVLCTVRPDRAGRLLIPLTLDLPGIDDPGTDDSDDEEAQAYLGECAELLYDLGAVETGERR